MTSGLEPSQIDQQYAMARRIEAAGVAIESETTWPSGLRSLYFRDPAGNSLECASPSLWNIQ